MDLSQQKEQFSLAYIQAVAAAAGYATYRPSVDDDSVDLGIATRGGGGTTRSPRIELQLKCTARPTPGELTFGFALVLKNYDELRPTDLMVPRILVVVLVPDDLADWIDQTETELAMRRCGYWLSLAGEPETTNTSTVTVQITRRQLFSVEGLCGIMERIASGGVP